MINHFRNIILLFAAVVLTFPAFANNNGVNLPALPHLDASELVGRGTSGPTAAITLGAGLTMSGTQLDATTKLTSATKQSTTSGTEIDFTSIPSGIRRITIMLRAVSTNGSNDIQIQIGSGSYSTSGYDSAYTNIVNASSPGVGTFSAGFNFPINSASSAFTGIIVLTLVDSANNIWVAQGTVTDTGASSNRVKVFGGNKTLSGALDRLRMTTNGGTDTFDAGTMNIMYE